MQAFDFLAVLLSIILGLAITEVLQGFRNLILARGRVRRYAPSLIWSVTLIAATTQMWWAMFGLRDHATWTFGAFTVVLLQTIFQYLASALVLPATGEAGDVDLRAHYFDHRRWFFGALLAMLATSLSKDLVLDGAIPVGANLGFHLALMAAFAVAILTRGPLYHRLLAPAVALIIAVYIALLFDRL
ncbi:hypothetical protein [Glacieibacterium frigidum]|uniref:Uncharacterized protein n=1 Tax=Glacieibacterium frigidum TaxID=2593303 RepID=A0A552UHR0_9SPHN|nr:hypothetical protein [Glacieibacterium frigidum]TRW17765.1 hypothetical protein FMM06_06405 [Glacieibacterium frigidum]